MPNDLVNLLLAIADDKLMLGHRNSDWTGLAPILEEDIAFSSIAQDEMAHAQALYELASKHDGRSADELAFGRAPADYRCAAIVTRPDEFDWATAIARQLFCDHLDARRLARLARSSDTDLAALGRRLVDEESVHVQHVDDWVRRLGTGTAESKTRLQQALDALAPEAGGLCEPVEGEDRLEASGVYPPLEDGASMFDAWKRDVESVARGAGLTLDVPAPVPAVRGGRRGVPAEHLATLLDEMCEVYRLEPGAAW